MTIDHISGLSLKGSLQEITLKRELRPKLGSNVFIKNFKGS